MSKSLRRFSFIVLYTVTCPGFLISQELGLTTSVSHGFPEMSRVNGVTENVQVVLRSVRSPSLGAEYKFSSGFLVTGNLSYQRDRIHIGETQNIYLPKISCWKSYRAYAVNFGCGYMHNLGASDFRIYTAATAGAGLVKSKRTIDTLDWDVIWEIIDEDGNYYMDTVQMRHEIIDHDSHGLNIRLEFITGAEYQREHLFFRAYVGAQTWLIANDNIAYTSYYKSSHYGFEISSTGNFTVRPGYLVCGIGVGWRFRNQET